MDNLFRSTIHQKEKKQIKCVNPTAFCKKKTTLELYFGKYKVEIKSINEILALGVTVSSIFDTLAYLFFCELFSTFASRKSVEENECGRFL